MNAFDLLSISPHALRLDVPLGLDVYSWHPGGEPPILFVASDQIVSEESHQRLTRMQDVKLYIEQSAEKSYREYLKRHLADWSSDQALPTKFRAAIMAEVVRSLLSEEFERNETPRVVATSQQLGTQLSQLVSDVTLNGSELCNILHHDYGTFTHSANVGFYCALLASELGFRDEQLSDIAGGGLLHDIGKLEIDSRILNKPGKLDEFEFKTIKTHPAIGFRRLAQIKEATATQRLMTYQHHERMDGKGYPVGIGGDEIDIASRICSVADVFEAMTSNRPYRGPMSRSRTLEIMESETGTSFDKEVFRCWSSIVNNRLSK